jgi:hypothetical protein
VPVAKPSIVYRPREEATPEAELKALAAIYKFVLGCHAKKEDAPKDAAVVRAKEEVSHVEQRSDRSSEITYPAAL